jgi:hypothetical protein
MIHALLAAALAQADPPPPPPIRSDIRPPVRYQGDAEATVRFIAPRQVEAACSHGRHVAGYVHLACTTGAVITLPNPCAFRHDWYAELACHEKAHLPQNGWPADHPR